MPKVRLVTTVRGGRQKAAAALSDQSLDLPGDWSKITASRKEGHFLLPVGTSWVERDVLGICEEVVRISRGKLRIASCSCGKCLQRGHFPHVVVELGKHGVTYPVFGFRKIDHHVLDRIRQIHVSQNPEKKLVKANSLRREELKRISQEKAAQKAEYVEAALASSKFDWRGPDGIRTEALRTKL